MTLKWKTIHSLNSPSPRTGMSLTPHPTKPLHYLFGGASHEEQFKNDLYIFHYDELKWELIDRNGDWPHTRYEHGATIIKTPKALLNEDSLSCLDDEFSLLIFGGASEKGPLNDVWLFFLGSRKWKPIITSGDIPSPRTCKSLALFSNYLECGYKQKLYLFGGGANGNEIADSSSALYTLDLETFNWSKVIASEGPEPRLGCTLSLFKKKLYLIGGMKGDHCFDNVWIYDLEKESWELQKVTGSVPCCTGHTSVIFNNNSILLFGGLFLSPRPRISNEMYSLNLESLEWNIIPVTETEGDDVARLAHDMSPFYKRNVQKLEVVNTFEDNSGTSIRDEISYLLFGGMDFDGLYNTLYELQEET